MPCFIRLRGKVFGPFDEARLKKMRDTGKIGRTTDLSEDGFVWKPAASFEILYPQRESEATTAPRPETRTESLIWFYSVDGREGYGPVSESSVIELLRARQLNPRSYVWRQGENARAVQAVPEFSGYAPPPRHSPQAIDSRRLFGVAVVLLFLIVVVGFFVLATTFRSTNRPSAPVVANSNSAPAPSPDGTATTPVSSPAASARTEDIVERVEQSIARIQGQYGSGTAFLIRPGILATNHHVINGEFIEQVQVTFPSVTDARKGPFDAQLLYFDRDRDIAFLRIASNLPPLTLVENHRFKRGQDIIAVGSPGNLENAVNIGVLSSEKTIAGQDYYQLGISINSGNSGGPVMDREGRVIGIVTLKSRVQEGIAFCVPAANIRNALTKTEELTASEIAQNNSEHRAQAALRMLFRVYVICGHCMLQYDKWMKVALDNGDSADDGINFISEQIEEKMQVVQYIFRGNMEDELKVILKDARLSKEFRGKLAEFHSNCVELKSYVDRPRGTVDSYKLKLVELIENGHRLHQQLAAMLGISDEDDE